MLSNAVKQSRNLMVTARAFGGHHHHDAKHVIDHVDSKQTDFKQPTKEDLEY